MNKRPINRFARWLPALLAALAWVPGLCAQTESRPVQSRVLLIFDTSSAMKKRLPAEEKGVKQLVAMNLLGQLHAGDSVGVWTFDEDVRTGEFPLQHWQIDSTTSIAQRVVDLIHNHRYAHTTSFTQLVPMINRLVGSSAQLTIFIFCDGDGQLAGTPVDASVNNIFKQNSGSMKKMRQPFVIVLRSQFGQYTGFTINTADSINIPSFPPPPPAPVQYVPPPPPPPAPTPAPLIIIGNNAGTNPLPPPPAPKMIEKFPPPAPIPPAAPVTAPTAPPQTFSTPPASPAPNPMPETKPATPIPATVAESAPTNTIAASTSQAAPPAPAAMPAALAIESSGMSRPVLFAVACGVLFVIVLLAYIIIRLSRRRHSPSLITESLKKS